MHGKPRTGDCLPLLHHCFAAQRRHTQVEQLQIDRVIGLSPPSTGTVAHCPSNADLLAYPAGSFAVVYNSSSRQQLRLLRSTTSNAQLGCIAWSASGEQLAAGEAGSSPAILVWDWNGSKCLAELKAHKHSIACVRFSKTDGGLT
jgi:WD40 repeat protein